MGHIEGKNVTLLIDNGTTYVPALCGVSLTVDTTIEMKDVLAPGDGSWKKPRPQKGGYSVSIEGVTEFPLGGSTMYDTFHMLGNQTGFTNVSFKIYFESAHGTIGANVIKMMEGEAVVETSQLTAGAENLMDSSFNMLGYGAYELFDSISACNATLTTFTLFSQSPVSVIFSYTGLAGTDRLEYSVDGSTRRALVGRPASDSFTVSSGVGMIAGAHTIVLWPVCANGDDGTSLTVNYTKT